MEAERGEWTAQRNLQEAQGLKERGNAKYAEKDFKEALRCYHKGILHLAGIIDKTSAVASYTNKVASGEVTVKANELKFSIYSNMAQIYIFQQKYDKGLEILAKAAAIKTNAKLHYRKGICFMKVSEFQRAREEFQRVVDLDPSQLPQVKKLRSQMRELQKRQQQKSKNLFQKFFK